MAGAAGEIQRAERCCGRDTCSEPDTGGVGAADWIFREPTGVADRCWGEGEFPGGTEAGAGDVCRSVCASGSTVLAGCGGVFARGRFVSRAAVLCDICT